MYHSMSFLVMNSGTHVFFYSSFLELGGELPMDFQESKALLEFNGESSYMTWG